MKKYLEGIWAAVGLLLGLALGVGYAWVIHPADFRGAEPSSLQPLYRGEYILLVASAYEATGDLDRARSRLALFPELDPDRLSALAQQVVASQGSEDAARGLARLSVALSELTRQPAAPSAMAAYASTPTAQKTPTDRPTLVLTVPYLPTPTRKPTLFSTLTPPAGFTLITRETVCNPLIVRPLIQVVVRKSDGKGVPGIEIRIQWDGGGSRFTTGMKPDLSEGYADYEIEPGKVYQISLGNGLTVVKDLVAPACTGATAVTGGTATPPYTGSWRLVFEMR